MYKAVDIAAVILHRNQQAGNHGMTHLRLQKLMYLAHKLYWDAYGKRLFNEQIHNYRHGPTIESVQRKFDRRGCKFVTNYNGSIEHDMTPQLHFKQSREIDRVVQEYANLPETELIALVRGNDTADNTAIIVKKSEGKSPRKYITYNGVTKTLTEWSKYREIKKETLSIRLKRGWSVGEALGFKDRK